MSVVGLFLCVTTSAYVGNFCGVGISVAVVRMLVKAIYFNLSLSLIELLCMPVEVRGGTFFLIVIYVIGRSCYSASIHSDLNLVRIVVTVCD
jgi:hypothetical protein